MRGGALRRGAGANEAMRVVETGRGENCTLRSNDYVLELFV